LHGFGQGVCATLYRSELFLMILEFTTLSGDWHEFGHATARRYGGAGLGRIGTGIHIDWLIFSLATAGAYFLAGSDRCCS
jgi:putative peptide zinc metalloprotease protein